MMFCTRESRHNVTKVYNFFERGVTERSKIIETDWIVYLQHGTWHSSGSEAFAFCITSSRLTVPSLIFKIWLGEQVSIILIFTISMRSNSIRLLTAPWVRKTRRWIIFDITVVMICLDVFLLVYMTLDLYSEILCCWVGMHCTFSTYS